MEMGGGRGNGGGFDMDEFRERFENGEDITPSEEVELPEGSGGAAPPDNGGGMQLPVGDFTPPEDGEMQIPERGEIGEMPGRGEMGEMPGRGEGGEFTMPEEGGFGADRGGMMGSDDVYLIYTDDDPESYPNIFDNAKTDVSASDEERLIAALKALNEGGDVSDCVDVEAVIRYFVAHNFVCNFDSYTGSMVHNYYLYEEDGILSMLPWDYNLAFGGFMSGSDATSLVNWDIDEPVSGGTVESRPMLAWIFESEEYTELYHEIFAEFIDSVFTSGWFEELMDETVSLIAPYVELDPTKFCTYEEFELGVETLRKFCLLRAESITYQLAGGDVTVDAGALDVSDMGSMNTGGERRVDFEPGTW